MISLDGIGDPDHVVRATPIVKDGVLFLPAKDMAFATESLRDGTPITGTILLQLTPTTGLNARMSPASLRAFAAEFLKAATEIESAAHAAALARIRGGEGK